MNATLFVAQIPVRDSLTNLRKKNVGYKVLHFINNEDREALGYKTLRHKDAVASLKDNKALGHFFPVFSLYSLM